MTYEDDALRAAAELSAKHINDRFLPDKAIDVIDEAGAADRLRARGAADRQGHHRRTSRRWSPRWRKIPAEERLRVGRRSSSPTSSPSCRSVIFGQDQAIDELVSAIKLSRSGLRSPEKPIGSFLFSRPHRRGQDRAGQAARQGAGRGVPALRHERVLGEAHRLAAHRRAAGLRRLRPGRPAHRRDPQAPVRGGGARRDREGPPGPVQHPAPGDGPRHAHRQQRAQGRLPQRGPHPHHQRRRAGDERQDHRLRRTAGPPSTPRKAKEAIERTFTPEFRNRLDGWILFSGLAPEIILKVVDKEVGLLQAQLVGQEGDARAHAARRATGWPSTATTRRSARGRWRGWWTSRSRSRWPRRCSSASCRTAGWRASTSSPTVADCRCRFEGVAPATV